MKLFVTGGTGFIGSHFLKQAIAAGHEVVAIRRPGSTPRIQLDTEPTWIEGNLDDDWGDVLNGCEALVHFAAYGVQNTTAATWDTCLKWNVTALSNLMNSCVVNNINKYVIAGSCFEYGKSAERYKFIPTDAPLEPTGPYHASKASATMIALAFAHQFRLQLSILRPFHVYGEGESSQRIWQLLKSKALAGEDLPMTASEQIRDFVPVERVAKSFLDHCVTTRSIPGHPKIYNLGTGVPQTLRQFAEIWWNHWNARGKIRFGEIPYRENEVMRYVPQL